MTKVYNFNAGPAILPRTALEQAQQELLDYQGIGMSVLEISHRSKEYEAINSEAEARMKRLLGIGDDYRVLFLQGGASLQFAMLPMNFLPGERQGEAIVVPGVLTVPARSGASGAVSVGLRPEDLVTCPAEEAAFRLQTTLVGPLGAETIVHGHAGGHPLIAKLPGSSAARVGERLPLRIAPTAMHLFDTASGVRVTHPA